MSDRKLTIKQENFCQAFLETGDLSEAYRRSYNTAKMSPKSINGKAWELKNNGEITGRIENLLESAQKRNRKTMDDLLRDLEEARQLALETQQPSVMVTATMGSAKLLGLDKPAPEDDDKGDIMQNNFTVNASIDEIKVTRGQPAK